MNNIGSSLLMTMMRSQNTVEIPAPVAGVVDPSLGATVAKKAGLASVTMGADAAAATMTTSSSRDDGETTSGTPAPTWRNQGECLFF